MKLWISLTLAASFAGQAFALPKSSELVSPMGMGINIGNTMEVPGNPTAWGNSFPTAEYVKAIKAAGFNTVRIPCAWHSHATNGLINAGWLDSVKTVVDLVVGEGMYALLNSHWDTGWLEDHVFDGAGYDKNGEITVKADSIAALQENYWKQIATKFAAYDEHLLFASANEPGVNDPWMNGGADNGQWGFDDTRAKVLKKYHEACLKAVRATGGNNATRTVVVQMPRTEIDKYELLANNYPTDPAGNGYTMAEAHYYPYQYSLMTKDDSWGSRFFYFDGMNSTTDTKHNMGSTVDKLGSKAHIDAQFDKLQSAFVAKGIPVVIGEMGAIKRLEDIMGDNLRLHLQGRAAWYGYVASAAKARGIIPYVWDTGDESNGNMTIIHRQDKFAGNVGDIVDYEVLNAMRTAYDMDTLAGNSIDKFVEASLDTSDKMLKITYTSATSDSSETGTMRIDLNGADWSDYVAISFQAKVNVTSAGPCTGAKCDPYAWTSLSFFAMSGNWKWSDYNFEETDISTAWKTYSISLDANGLNLADKADVKAIGLNLYGSQVSGTIEMDNIVLHKADGSEVVLENFSKKLPTLEGIASGELVIQTSAIKRPTAKTFGKMLVNVLPGTVNASFVATAAGRASLALVNSNGQIVSSKTFTMNRGTNSVLLETNYRGPGFLILKQNSNRTTVPVRLK
mgnify:FL=1